MKVFICIDNSGGMMFNSRRVSRDSAVINRIVEELKVGETLYIHPYSVFLFEGKNVDLRVHDDFLKKVGKNNYCFVENNSLLRFVSDIEELVVFCWNRDYPADLKLCLNLDTTDLFELVSTEDFEGSSHPQITMKKYIRK